MGVSMITGLEIYTQPDDLQFVVGESEREKGKYGILISRGPGHRFKILISTPCAFDSREAAVGAVLDLLAAVCEAAKKELGNPSSFIAAIVNPNGRPVEDANVLTQERIEKIVEDLRAGRVANTYAEA